MIYPSPGFPIYESFTGYVGAKPVPLHLREEADFSFSGRDLAPLITERTRVIILNFPSNPTGGVATREQLEEIADVICAKAPDRRGFIPTKFTKTFCSTETSINRSLRCRAWPNAPSLPAAYRNRSPGPAAGSAGPCFPTVEEAAVFKNLNINYFSCIPAYNQMGAVVALESPLSAIEMARMCDAFCERRDMMVAGLNTIPGIRCRKPGGAFYLFPNIARDVRNARRDRSAREDAGADRERSSPATLLQMFLLWRHQVATMDRRSFGSLGSEGQHYLRILNRDRAGRSQDRSRTHSRRRKRRQRISKVHPGRQTPMLTDSSLPPNDAGSPDEIDNVVRTATRHFHQCGRSPGRGRRAARRTDARITAKHSISFTGRSARSCTITRRFPVIRAARFRPAVSCARLLFDVMDYDLSHPQRTDADIISYAAGHKALGLYAMWALRNEIARIAAPDLLPDDEKFQFRLEDLLGFRRNPVRPTPLFKQFHVQGARWSSHAGDTIRSALDRRLRRRPSRHRSVWPGRRPISTATMRRASIS